VAHWLSKNFLLATSTKLPLSGERHHSSSSLDRKQPILQQKQDDIGKTADRVPAFHRAEEGACRLPAGFDCASFRINRRGKSPTHAWHNYDEFAPGCVRITTSDGPDRQSLRQ
jgi:hypothetical protein